MIPIRRVGDFCVHLGLKPAHLLFSKDLPAEFKDSLSPRLQLTNRERTKMKLTADSPTSAEVLIRPYVKSDFVVLQRILIDAFEGVSIDHAIELLIGEIEGFGWKYRKGRDLAVDIDRDIEGLLVADICGQPVGFISTWQDKEAGIGHIPNLAVASEHRGKGIGRKLIEAAIERFHKSGLAAAKIETLLQNKRANALYTSEGFVEVARQLHLVRDLRTVGENGRAPKTS
jgi:ribosomal protein S18 acetylase RimI-like enzyme